MTTLTNVMGCPGVFQDEAGQYQYYLGDGEDGGSRFSEPFTELTTCLGAKVLSDRSDLTQARQLTALIQDLDAEKRGLDEALGLTDRLLAQIGGIV